MSIYSTDRLSPASSEIAFWAVGLLIAYAVGRPFLGMLINFVRARVADRRGRANAPLVAGPAIVRGIVAPEDDGAVRVEISLERRTRTNPHGGTEYCWTEVDRKGSARPFRLRLDSGVALSVDPGEHWRLIQELETPQFRPPDTVVDRIRVARLSAGETVVAVGELVESGDPLPVATAGSYRDLPARALVLRPRGDEPMLLSAGSLGLRYRDRADRWIPWLLGAFLVAIYCEGFLVSPYYALRAHGESVAATVSRFVHTPREGKTPERCVVTAVTPDNLTVTDSADCAFAPLLAVGSTVSFVMIPHHPETAQIGEPTLHDITPMACLFLIGGIIMMEFLQRGMRPWYHPHRVTEGQ
jgi:hypothetical protein